MLCLLINLAISNDLIIAGTCRSFSLKVELFQNIDDRVGQYLDQALSKQISLTVEEAQKIADVTIHGFWSLLGKLLKENGDILDSNCLMRAVCVEYLAG